jgi:hypothetical protein
MTTQDYLDAIGDYFGEPRVALVLKHLGIEKTPKKPRGERSVNFSSESLGVEIAFTDEGSLDVPNPRYPEGALVLSSVRFYGPGSREFKQYTGRLPHELSFDMRLADVSKLLGAPAFSNEFIGTYRWDLQHHCIFVDCEVGKKVTQICVQLPVA